MNRILLVLASTLCAPALKAEVVGLTLNPNDAYYVGRISDGAPASLADALDYINLLRTIEYNDPADPYKLPFQNPAPNPDKRETYDRNGSSIPKAELPVVIADFAYQSPSFPSVPGTGSSCGTDPAGHPRVCIDLSAGANGYYRYILAKYDGQNPGAGSYVWYVPASTTAVNIRYFVPQANKYAISHSSLFNPGTSVPDTGVTHTLFGVGLVAVQTLRRRWGA